MGISRERIESKEITVGIIGLGYVGLPLSLVFAEAGISVIGFDVDKNKIAHITAGESYIVHVREERIRKTVDSSLFSATNDFSRISECDAVIICVPTPLNDHLEPELSYIEDTCKTIAPHITPHTLISLESTTWPGTTEEVVKPLLEKGGECRVGTDLYLCYSPEREDPGNATFSAGNIPKLIGGIDETSTSLGAELYRLAINEVIPMADTKSAEAAKLFENIFRSVNIALVNELKIIFDKMDINVWDVIKGASTKPFGYMPFWPGPGLGGHCIPIDPFYLTWKAREFGINTRFIELSGEINRNMPEWVVGKVQDCLNTQKKSMNGSRILVLGLAYKPDVTDIRESPSLELLHLLKSKGVHAEFHDPLIEEIPPTREYESLLGKRSCALSADYDCFLLATNHSIFNIEEILSYNIPIVDTRNVFPDHDLVFRA